MSERKKIVVLGNGWSPEFDQIVIDGIKKYSKENPIDIHIFISYCSQGSRDEQKGEINIFHLPDLDTYDGIIVLGNTLYHDERVHLCDILKKTKTPVISLEYELPGHHYLGSDNYSGMYDLATHLFEDHEVKSIVYISGPANHAEAQERLRAVSDACLKYKVPLNSDNLLYGDFSYYSPVDLMTDYLAVHNSLPDAIMCANDTMAIGLCEKIEEWGYQVPSDVIITGFDALESGINYSPSLSSVNRNWENMGYEAVSFLLEQASTTESSLRRIIPSSKSIGESCGCTLCKEKFERRLNQTKTNGRVHSIHVTFDMHLRVLYSHMKDSVDEQNLHEVVSKVILGEKDPYETDTFCLCLDPNFFDSKQQDSVMKDYGYADCLHTVVNLSDGVDCGIETLSPKELLPKSFQKQEAQTFLFVPIHIKDLHIGYAIFKAQDNLLQGYSLFIWSRHLFQNFEQIYQNIKIQILTDKLTSLSVTDGLTGLYNRNGCNKIAIPFYRSSLSEKKNVALIMCDVDSMKEINDTYGHLQGDLALSTIASAIKKGMSKDWLSCRFGGDEFLIIGLCPNEQELLEHIRHIEDLLKQEVVQAHVPYPLIASFGGALITPDHAISFEAALKKADKIMYQIKGKHKEKTGGSIR